MSAMSPKLVHIYKVSTVFTGLLYEGQQKSFLLYICIYITYTRENMDLL